MLRKRSQVKSEKYQVRFGVPKKVFLEVFYSV